MGKMQGILELRTYIAGVPTQNADVGDINWHDALRIILGFFNPQRGRTGVEIVGCLRIETCGCNLSDPATRGISITSNLPRDSAGRKFNLKFFTLMFGHDSPHTGRENRGKVKGKEKPERSSTQDSSRGRF